MRNDGREEVACCSDRYTEQDVYVGVLLVGTEDVCAFTCLFRSWYTRMGEKLLAWIMRMDGCAGWECL